MRAINNLGNGKKIGSVMVIGGGIGGIQASLDLAESGYKVFLVDSSPTIGGVMAQLDKTFPTNDCSMCILSPKLVECGRHLNIEHLTNTTVRDVQGGAGHFHVLLTRKPRYVDAEKCTGCGECAKHCPVDAIDTFNQGLSKRTAIYIKYPQAVPLSFMIDKERCIGCGLCEKMCLAGAIRYDDKETEESIDVGAVILSPGYDLFNARRNYEYGYGKYPNVLTSIEFERILSASGPYKGHMQRPSDRKIPERIAFLQCVGSRDEKQHMGYCSSVCCTYAIKEAIIAKEHSPLDLDATIFFMDLRTYGKDFDKYYERAKNEYKIRFVRSRVYRIEETNGTGDLNVIYTREDGKTLTEPFDMVILSIGFSPPANAAELARKIGINLNAYSFIQTRDLDLVETSKEGIYVCGAFSGPKDIPETVMQASGAAAKAGTLLSDVRGTLVKEKVFPPEMDVAEQEPRIGAFICHCGINIGGVVDVPAVVAYARTLPNVVYAEDNLYTCSQDTQEKIKKTIKEHGLNRVVVASCSPRTHEPLFQETIKEAGLNRYLFEMANIRDQCSWIHMHEPEKATRKAKQLVSMAIAKARLIEPLATGHIGVTGSALVIGGGMAGMASALTLAKAGYHVYLVEKEAELGGMARRIRYTLEGQDIRKRMQEMIHASENHPLISVIKNATIVEIAGYVGNFTTGLMIAPRRGVEEIKHGVVIVATGAQEYRPTEYLYGKDPRVLTQLELEERIAASDENPASGEETPGITDDISSMVMINCVGSREEGRMYCSRVCCSKAIRNALTLKECHPAMNIYILYRDIRTYGFREEYYRKAREQGIIFIRYDLDQKPEVIPDTPNTGKRNRKPETGNQNPKNHLKVKVYDPILNQELIIPADLLVLAAAIVPPQNDSELAKFLKVPKNEDGFYLEAHVKLRPVDFATEGVFLAGLAHSPKFIDESIAQARAAAGRAMTILSKPELETEGIIAAVNEEICDGCGICEPICEYKAIEIVKDGENKKARVNEILCKGCGACVAACPSGAMEQQGFKGNQLMAMIDIALEDIP